MLRCGQPVCRKRLAGGERISTPVCSGDMGMGKHAVYGAWGKFRRKSGVLSHAPPRKVLGVWKWLGTASHFFIVTPRLLTTLGFPTTQGKSGRAAPALGFALRFGPSGLFATARTLLIIPFPLLHFNWECGIYKGIWDISGIFLTVLNGKIACLPWSERGGRRLKAALLGVACSPGSGP